ncbi:hypothetical protein [Lapillicoccus jejuensis]|uniref:Uncharacterized protein n=1 Tax=Lapillicoccus jejuensis TaxID=402171 RepID=A0A542E1V4_9MICO|nr:hypothetical protein [Lapillicoccus jejuensis]TQJ09295.1 hypothetical protein FB458_2405 [Lapillicoccus jejuensis]
MDTPSTDIGPGLGAFVAFFALAVILWFLVRNMNARMRRMGYAERERVERLEAEHRAAQEGERPPPAAPPAGPEGDGPDGDPPGR